MSFVYATKTKTTFNNTIIERMCILSDMRITECNPACWGKETAALIEKHGIHKSVLVAPNCCVSFAGNNILHANRLITHETITRRDVIEFLRISNNRANYLLRKLKQNGLLVPVVTKGRGARYRACVVK